ncbi:SUMO-specific isopeptidase USPL1 isoform X2 [Eublepharis macularius]|nr:SUMO-specific isopeptidase USPL1 isoform X2 [Eublepharis macularius]
MESTQQEIGLEKEAQEDPPHAFIVQKPFLSNSEPCSSVSKILPQDSNSVSEPQWLQWKNVHALCWLDCILSILVHLETLKIILAGSVLENSSLTHRLLAEYNRATALVNNCERGEHISEVPVDVLSRAESHLNEIRNTVFAQLQPRLQCQLGKKESPVFAFPLILQNDPQIEKFFLHSFSWKFQCLQCGHQVSDRCQKTLTTFTNIIPEWHPLNAVHIAPCNNCNHRTQRRKMVLEKIPSILMMHFVEGLPHNDLMTYSFHFQEDFYQITAVIQYLQEPKHFVAWISNSDGTWLECDDLKGSYCSRHERFGVPPSEVHIVIWEKKPQRVIKELDLQLQKEGAGEVPQKAQPNSSEKHLGDEAVDKAPLICHGEDPLNAHSSDTQDIVGSDKCHSLWGFENFADDDEITLTLVNVTPNSNDKPLEDNKLTEKNLVAETLPQQDPGRVDVSSLLENTYVPLHRGQPNNESTTFIMSALSPNNNRDSPETLPIRTAVAQSNPIPVLNSVGLDPDKLQNNISRKKTLNTVQELPNAVGHTREMAINCQVSAPNCSSQLPCQSKVKPFVTSWLKNLHGKKTSFMPKSVSVCKTESSQKPLQKGAVLNPLVKGPAHFGGFIGKCSQRELKKSAKRALPSLPSTIPPLANNSIEKQIFGSEGTVNSITVTSIVNKLDQAKQSRSRNQNFTAVEKDEDSNANKARQWRIQFRQLLKDKKERLALLEKQANTQLHNRSSPKKSIKEQSQLGSQKENDSLQSLLRELQCQIDIEDGKSLNSPGTSMSQCSSLSYDDILSELLSPATTVASLEHPTEEECKYLEMGGCGIESPVSNEKIEGAQYLEHDYCVPEKESLYGGHPDMLETKSPLKKFNFQSPTEQGILEELLPSSVLNSIMDEFDENLLPL